MNRRDNILRAVRFETPEYIPMAFHINGACWHHYPQEHLVELMLNHKLLFPGYKPPKLPHTPAFAPMQRKGVKFVDDWGCTWETTDDGITGTVTLHPLADWTKLDSYSPPDPARVSGNGPIDWERITKRMAEIRASGGLASGGLRHGHTFLALCDIHGYQETIFDMADDEPKLWKLVEMLETFNMGIVKRYMDAGVEWMSYPEDLGMQTGPMLSPDQFRKFIKPSYQRLMKPARDKGCIVHMHSDGHIQDLADDLVDGGVEVLNLQDLVNGIDWIRRKYAGKVCIDLDIDRQQITRFGTPKQIDDLIKEEVTKLATKKGGLTMIFGLYPGTPLENVKALMDAMERYATYYS
ncbi:MAG: hypothetical protein C0404_05560 [Verrucomicrobia bacterium]|nr:hypothetical protein [Verrucomicrobiota bacterium]